MNKKNSDTDFMRQQFLRALQLQPTSTDCEHCITQLDTYINLQLSGEPYQKKMPEVTLHLDICPECADIYARFYELALALATNTLPEPKTIPEPDLSFLSTPQTTPSLPELLQKAVQQTANWLSVQLSELLLPLLQPPPTAFVTRTLAERVRYEEVLLHISPEQLPFWDFPVHITAFRDRTEPSQCLVEVSVLAPGKEWPELAGQRVRLIVDERREETETDPWGVAAFPDVSVSDLPRLRLEIELNEAV
ncbi:MAG: hypothetical protein D6706_12270 [Chloroflexi bacterium]|nr:MAG: hypothetical protein D6706_12270 [Chloroflexota bacterium]